MQNKLKQIQKKLVELGDNILGDEEGSGKFGTFEDALHAYTAAQDVDRLLKLAERSPDVTVRAYAEALRIVKTPKQTKPQVAQKTPHEPLKATVIAVKLYSMNYGGGTPTSQYDDSHLTKALGEFLGKHPNAKIENMQQSQSSGSSGPFLTLTIFYREGN